MRVFQTGRFISPNSGDSPNQIELNPDCCKFKSIETNELTIAIRSRYCELARRRGKNEVPL
jgi:hypothetical protein